MTAIGYLFISVIPFSVFFFLSFCFSVSEWSFWHLCINFARDFIIHKHFKHPLNTAHTHGTVEIYLNWTLSRCKVKIALKITVTQCWCIEMCIALHILFVFWRISLVSTVSFLFVHSFVEYIIIRIEWVNLLCCCFFAIWKTKSNISWKNNLIFFSHCILVVCSCFVSFRS